MKVSVVIPTYNRCNELKRALESIQGQTLQPSETVIVDDGSADGTLDMLRMCFGKDIKIISQPNKGVSVARNRGIKESQGEWIAFLDSDDWWLPTKLERQVRFHQEYPQYIISQTDEIWIRNNVRINPRQYHLKKADWIFEFCLDRCMITPSATMIKKQIVEDLGSFDENLPACEDYDLWLRIASKYPVGLIQEKLVVKTGGHPDQLSGKYWGMDRFRVEALEKLLQNPLDNEKRRSALHVLIKKLMILAHGSVKRNKLEDACIYQSRIDKYQTELECLNEAYQHNH